MSDTSSIIGPATSTSSTTPVDLEVHTKKEETQTPEFIQPSIGEKYRNYFVQQDHESFNLDETVKRFQYLLDLTDLFKHFIDFKLQNNSNFAKLLSIVENRTKNKRRKTEKEEDAELLKDEQIDSNEVEEFTESPGYILEGKLRPYQIQGLNWLISLHKNNLSGILADEMGLGKTLQTISFLGYLRYYKNVLGPHLVVVPKSTLDNWSREFLKWTPEVNTLVLHGDKDQRSDLIKNRILTCDFDVIITSYEIVIREKLTLRKFNWNYIIIDELHRIKNEESMLSQIIRMFHSQNRLLITGTPLQNNLHELWALLNFILPDIFASSELFDEWFKSKDSDALEKGDQSESLVSQLHRVLQPFLLRRIKNDVEKLLLPKKELNIYLGMTKMQKSWYQSILEKDIDAVHGTNGKRESKTRLLNIVMQLRKCCNHPYLFEGAEPGPPYSTDEHLVFNSQKMKVLDKLLAKSRQEGSRVLIFSQMSRMLDILEDYCIFREYEYCRIDGQTDHLDRIQAIDDYNAPDSKKFVFLLTTRAGGLGINLTSANIVVLFDSDWNPQLDLQAMDRAHRIGQKKQVHVYRFITENAIEEKVLERLSQKLRLDQLVIQQGRNHGGLLLLLQQQQSASKDELLNMIQHGALEVFESNLKSEPDGNETDDLDFESLLQNSEAKTKELNAKYLKLGLDDLQNFTSDESVYEWNGQNFQKKEVANGRANGGVNGILMAWLNPAKRERKENYNIDGYYRDVLNTGGPKSGVEKVSGPKPPKNLNMYDHQFYPLRLYELHDLEKNYYKKMTTPKLETLELEDLDGQLDLEEIKRARALTPEEETLKQELIQEGFSNWSRRDFYHFIQMLTQHGRHNLEKIAEGFEDKSLEDVVSYSKVFWSRYYEIENFERYLQQIEAGEEKLRKIKLQKKCLLYKLTTLDSKDASILQDGLILKYHPPQRQFNLEEDRFIIWGMFKHGIDNPNLNELIRTDIKKSPIFRFDYFIKSRSGLEIGRRCQSLLNAIVKEVTQILEEKKQQKKRPRAKNSNSKTKKGPSSRSNPEAQAKSNGGNKRRRTK